MRFRSTDAIGVYPTPDHSVAALLWSEQEAIAKAAKGPATAKRKAGQKVQTQPGDGVTPKPASAAKTKGKGVREHKVSQASGRQPTKVKSKSPAGKHENILSVPKSSTIPKSPPSLMGKLREIEIAHVKAASFFDMTKTLSDKDEYLGQTHKSESEHTAGPDETAKSGQGNVRSGVKAAKRLKKASSGKGDALAEHNKAALAEPSAHDSGSVEDSTAKVRKRPKGNAKASKAKAAKSSGRNKIPSGLRIWKLGSAGRDVPRKVLSIQSMNAAIEETEAALDRRDREVRRESTKERLAQASRRSKEAPAKRKNGTKSVKSSDSNVAKSIKSVFKQEKGGNFQGAVGTDIQTVHAAELDIARM